MLRNVQKTHMQAYVSHWPIKVQHVFDICGSYVHPSPFYYVCLFLYLAHVPVTATNVNLTQYFRFLAAFMPNFTLAQVRAIFSQAADGKTRRRLLTTECTTT